MVTTRGRRASRYGREEKSKGSGSGIFGGMAVREESMSFYLLLRGLPLYARGEGWLMWERVLQER